MSFARQPTQPPDFDAGALIAYIQKIGAKTGAGTLLNPSYFPRWKRWLEATGDQDGKGLRDVVAANATALNAVKADSDKQASQLAALASRVASLEAKPAVPFPGYSQRTAGASSTGTPRTSPRERLAKATGGFASRLRNLCRPGS